MEKAIPIKSDMELIEDAFHLHRVLPSQTEVAMALKLYLDSPKISHLDAVIQCALRVGISPNKSLFLVRNRNWPKVDRIEFLRRLNNSF